MNKKKISQAAPLKQPLHKNAKNNVATNAKQANKAEPKPIEPTVFDRYWSSFIGGYGVWVAVLLSLLMVLIVFNDFMFGNLTMLYKDIGSDTITSFYPAYLTGIDATHNWGYFSPAWSFSFGLGQTTYGGYEFINLIVWVNYYINSTVDLSSAAPAIALEQAGFFFLAAILAYAYLRIMSVDKYVSILGSLILCMFGFMTLGSGWYSYSYTGVQFLFLLYAFELLYQRNIWIVFPYAAFMAGGLSPQLFFFSEFLFVYFSMRFFSENGWKPLKFLLIGLKIIVLAVLGIMFSSSALLSRYAATVEMPRFYGNASSYAAKLSNLPMFGLENTQFDYNIPYHHYKTAILRLFSNDILGCGADYKGWYNYLEAPIFYCGLLTLLLVPQIFSFSSKKMKIAYAAFIGFWVFLVIFPFFRHAIHLFVGDYYKLSISQFFPFSMVLLAVLGFSQIVKGEKTINTKLLIGTFVALIVLLYYPYYPVEYNIINKDVRASVTGFLVVYTFLLYLLKYRRYMPVIYIALLLLVVFELSSFAKKTMAERPVVSKTELNQKVGFNDYSVDAVKYIKGIDKGFFRLEKEYQSSVAMHSSLNDGQAQGYYSTSCYSSSNQGNYIRFLEEARVISRGNETQTRWAPGLKTRPLLMSIANVKYILTKSDSSQSLRFGYQKIHKVGDVNIMKNQYSLPFGFTYDTFISKAEFDKLSNFQCDLSFLRSCVIDSADLHSELTKDLKQIQAKDSLAGLSFPLYRQLVDSLKADSLSLTEFKMDYIKGNIDLKKKKILYLSTSFDKNWHATVDGKETPVYRVNLGLLGIPVDKGKHEIVFSYQPKYAKESLSLQLFVYAVYLALIVWFFIDRRKKQKKEKEALTM